MGYVEWKSYRRSIQIRTDIGVSDNTFGCRYGYSYGCSKDAYRLSFLVQPKLKLALATTTEAKKMFAGVSCGLHPF